ncbi:MAG: hypothetical protein ABIQ64_03400 [Candidatus Saccharimonadales bacterium]
MQKVIIKTSIVIVLLALVLQPIVLNAVFSFLFAGIVPGTQITLPFWAMSCILFSIGYGATLWLKRDMLYIGDVRGIEKQRKQTARAYVAQKTSRSVEVKKPVRVRQRRRQQTATS